MSTPYERALDRLLLELIPTGTFGGPRPHPAPPTSPTQAAIHAAELDDNVEAYDRQHRGERPPATRRHLTAIPDTESDAA